MDYFCSSPHTSKKPGKDPVHLNSKGDSFKAGNKSLGENDYAPSLLLTCTNTNCNNGKKMDVIGPMQVHNKENFFKVARFVDTQQRKLYQSLVPNNKSTLVLSYMNMNWLHFTFVVLKNLRQYEPLEALNYLKRVDSTTHFSKPPQSIDEAHFLNLPPVIYLRKELENKSSNEVLSELQSLSLSLKNLIMQPLLEDPSNFGFSKL